MNVHISTESLTAAKCRGAEIVDQLAAAEAEYQVLDAFRPESEAGQDKIERAQCEILDREDHLMAEAEYVTPISARGALLVAVLMGRAARAALAPGDETDESPMKSMRRFRRLQDRLLAYLESASGETIESLGLDFFHVRERPGVAEALSRSPAVEVAA